MFNVTVLSLFKDSSFLYLERGWGGAEMTVSINVDKDDYLSGKEGCDHPRFSHLFSADSDVGLSGSKLPFLATEPTGRKHTPEAGKEALGGLLSGAGEAVGTRQETGT